MLLFFVPSILRLDRPRSTSGNSGRAQGCVIGVKADGGEQRRVEQQAGEQDQAGVAVGFEHSEAIVGVGDIEADDLPAEMGGKGEQGRARKPSRRRR